MPVGRRWEAIAERTGGEVGGEARGRGGGESGRRRLCVRQDERVHVIVVRCSAAKAGVVEPTVERVEQQAIGAAGGADVEAVVDQRGGQALAGSLAAGEGQRSARHGRLTLVGRRAKGVAGRRYRRWMAGSTDLLVRRGGAGPARPLRGDGTGGGARGGPGGRQLVLTDTLRSLLRTTAATAAADLVVRAPATFETVATRTRLADGVVAGSGRGRRRRRRRGRRRWSGHRRRRRRSAVGQTVRSADRRGMGAGRTRRCRCGCGRGVHPHPAGVVLDAATADAIVASVGSSVGVVATGPVAPYAVVGIAEGAPGAQLGVAQSNAPLRTGRRGPAVRARRSRRRLGAHRRG